MKRKIGLFALALALTATLVACGNKNASVDPSAPAVAPTDSAEPNNTMTPRTNNNIVGNADSIMRNAMDRVDNAARGAMESMDEAARGYGNAYDWNGGTAAEGYSGYPWTATNGGAADPGAYYYSNVE